MNLRQDLAAKSPGVTEVKHGDRLDIVEVRRRLVRVRTVDGIEGWVDAKGAASPDEFMFAPPVSSKLARRLGIPASEL